MPLYVEEIDSLWSTIRQRVLNPNGWTAAKKTLPHTNEDGLRGICVSGKPQFDVAFLKPTFWWESANEYMASLLAKKVSVDVPAVRVGPFSAVTSKGYFALAYCCSPSKEIKTRTLFETYAHLNNWQKGSVQRCLSRTLPFSLWVGNDEFNVQAIVIPRRPTEAYTIDYSLLSLKNPKWHISENVQRILKGRRSYLYNSDLAKETAEKIANLSDSAIKESLYEVTVVFPQAEKPTRYYPGIQTVFETLKIRRDEIFDITSRELLLRLPIHDLCDYTHNSPRRKDTQGFNMLMSCLGMNVR